VSATLVELRVRNLGVVDDVTIAVPSGMTALTGETGAGKTLLVEALGLLLGGRADPSVVRAGADEAFVEGRFLLAPSADRPEEIQGTEDGTEIVLARAVVRGGRSRAWIDGRMASVGALAEVAEGLVEAQRQALDHYGGIDVGPLDRARHQLRRLTDERDALGGDARQRAHQRDLLDFQIAEIEEAHIDDMAEDAGLEAEEERLADTAAHRQAATVALTALSEAEEASAVDRLAEAAGALGGRGPLSALHDRVRAAMAELADLATELRSVVETWDDDPERLAAIRGRRQLLRELQRKYGDDLAEVAAFAVTARRLREEIAADERRAASVDDEISQARATLEQVEATVATARGQAAPRLAAEIQATLRRLAMASARFAVAVEGTGPADQVTFMLGANAGEALQPLARAASGGELARTMLAIRLALTDAPGVMVFDEVDAGVGGAAATSVGVALAGLGRRAQVLVVTHLAQVAALADHQIAVRKIEEAGRTRSEVAVLDDENRVVELSRMLSGRPDSSSARRHARELLSGVPVPADAS
jgi:DNA repair protein RecN (Recombination protein N)